VHTGGAIGRQAMFGLEADHRRFRKRTVASVDWTWPVSQSSQALL
jgi:hypothetical protein